MIEFFDNFTLPRIQKIYLEISEGEANQQKKKKKLKNFFYKNLNLI